MATPVTVELNKAHWPVTVLGPGKRIGLWLQGRLFPLDMSDPLVFLGAIANRGIGAPYFLARWMDAGAGTVTAVSYEYGNTFLMTAGLLNFLVIVDAFDVAMGRK